MRIRRHLTTLGIAALTFGMPVTGYGQSDRPVGLLHGFMSGPGTWNQMAPALEGSLQIQTSRQDLPWALNYTAQMVMMGAPYGTDATLVGHSNGGVVSRLYGMTHGVQGVLTLGSPNSGAPLATSYPYILDYFSVVGSDLELFAEAFNLTGPNSMFGDWIPAILEEYTFGPLFNLLQGIGSWILTYVPNNDLLISADMQPSSSIFQDVLNSETGQFAQEQMIGTRVSVAVQTDNYFWGGPWRLESPSLGDAVGDDVYYLGLFCVTMGDQLWMHALMFDDNYSMYIQRAFAMWYLGDDFLAVDPIWCLAVGGGVCAASDEVVPTSRQHWGTVRPLVSPYSHIKETYQLGGEVQNALVANFGMVARN